MELNMIVAHDKNHGIGYENKIPWRIIEDLKHFRTTTFFSIVVMGRKTYESIPAGKKPLDNRINIVLTNYPEKYKSESNLIYCKQESLKFYIDLYHKISSMKKVFFIGGSEIYKKYIKDVKNLYVSYVDKEYKCDTYFPKYDEQFLLKTYNTIYSKQEDCAVIFKHYVGLKSMI
jgi:dihydrofolate reductase